MNYIKSIFTLSTNTKEQITSYGSISIEFVKIVLGSLLVVFIPQSCIDVNSNINGTTMSISRECTINENFVDLIQFNYFVLLWNFITLALFTINMIQELRRERFIILNFDYNKEKPMKAIYPIFKKYQKLEKEYMTTTIRLYYNNVICIICFIMNIVFSSIILFYYYYNGVKAITSILTNIILILQKVYKNYNILSYAKEKKVVLSTMLLSPYYYNSLDAIKFNNIERSSNISIQFNDEIENIENNNKNETAV